MTGPAGAAGVVAVGYLLGAIPVGLIVGRLVGGVDLRAHGSRRTGATNAMRALGPRWGALVLVLDLLKGLAAVLVAGVLFDAPGGEASAWVAAAAGLAAVGGHNWSIFMGFTGGRGVATAGGGLLGLSPLAVAAVVPVVVAVAWRTRYVSAGSLAGAAAAMLATVAMAIAGFGGWHAAAYAVAAGTLVVFAHRDNIERLRAGTERRIGEGEVIAGDGRP
ncbi:MAG TPA: glycerol-3-phosphate 1-O-acyltransferase PlsY [Candidatus Limnocylindria bacterium]|nr:glycerol-3-phosphate 1-O-acyltransferase PlsY [Candidatus Limnocylindria bacterium]